MSHPTIFHNPQCGTSRNTLALIRAAGIEPTIVEYLRTPPSREQLAQIIAAAGLTVRQAMRDKESLFRELSLSNPDLTDSELMDAMMEHPILINRPFVITGLGTRLTRPSETVLEILPKPSSP